MHTTAVLPTEPQTIRVLSQTETEITRTWRDADGFIILDHWCQSPDETECVTMVLTQEEAMALCGFLQEQFRKPHTVNTALARPRAIAYEAGEPWDEAQEDTLRHELARVYPVG